MEPELEDTTPYGVIAMDAYNETFKDLPRWFDLDEEDRQELRDLTKEIIHQLKRYPHSQP